MGGMFLWHGAADRSLAEVLPRMLVDPGPRVLRDQGMAHAL